MDEYESLMFVFLMNKTDKYRLNPMSTIKICSYEIRLDVNMLKSHK